jgi:hypothetical protein
MLEARYRPLTRYLIEAECTVSGGYAKTSKVPRDAHFAHLVGILVELYTRPLTDKELVLCVDEKTNLQPRPRLAPTLPTRSGSPTRLEHEYKRAGALHLFAAFDTRTGKVYARTERRKRQVEFLAFLSQLEQEIPVAKTQVYLVMDNLKMHKGKLVRDWLATHPRFVCHFVPVHCSCRSSPRWRGWRDRIALCLWHP